MNVMLTLARREFWEHRALWIAPLVMAVLLIGSAIGGRFIVSDIPEFTPEQALAILSMTIWAMNVAIFFVAAVVLAFYLLDCLYADRRDRSILFWKSLPVSDAATVLSKLGVALLIVPLATFVLAVFTDLAVRGILSLRSGSRYVSDGFPLWHATTWFKTQALLFVGLLGTILWYAPLAGYLLLVSAWARRNVFLWAVLPPLVLVLLEAIAFRTDRVLDFLGSRLEPGFAGAAGIAVETATVRFKRDSVISLSKLWDQLDVAPLFFNVPMILGLVAAAILVYAAIRIRRFRDDT
jgi:ABC-2 type transport system permease protein